MRKTNHILIYEAFNSNTLSKTVKFLDKEVGKDERLRFIKNLVRLSTVYDFTISDIGDEYFEYLNKKDSLLIRNEKDVDNKYGIFCLKFWFSIDKGYIGYTYTGNVIKTKDTTKLNKDELIKLDITSGELIKLDDNNIGTLKTGDIVVGYLSSDSYDVENLTRATVFEDDDKYYAIQNVVRGDKPDTSEDEWNKYGRYSYRIGRKDDIDSDNHKLHKYIDNGLSLINSEENLNVMSFNLPMKNDEVKSWQQIYGSISRDGVDESDFSVIFYYDDFASSSNKKSISKIISDREDSRKGATKLISDDVIRSSNIKRYISVISKKFGIDVDNFDPKNLEKIILKLLNGKLSLHRMQQDFTKDNISNLIEHLSSVIDSIKESEKYKSQGFNGLDISSDVSKIKEIIDMSYNNRSNRKEVDKVNDIINQLEKEDLTEEIKIIKKLLYLGDLFNKKLLSNPINNIDDLILVKYKMEMLTKIINDNRIGLSHNVKSFLDNIRYNDGDSLNAIRYVDESEGYEKAWDRLNKLEYHINKL